MKNYELIEHTADVGVRIKADSLKGLFKTAALAMFDIMAKEAESGSKEIKKIDLKLEADDLDELFVTWLNELLSLSATKELIFCDFEIKELGENNLDIILIGSDIKNFEVKTEIKAATYHELKVEQVKGGWKAEVIFDV